MTLTFSHDRVLALVAHPDDAELLCAGTLARARDDGAAIAICVLCRGDKGQPARPIPNLAGVRRREMAAAARLLKAETFSVGVPDSTLCDDRETRRKVTEVFRRFRPTLVLAHAPEDYHPDHRAAGALAEAASWHCASRGYKTKSPALPAAPALWWMDTIGLSGFEPGFFIDVSPFLSLKEQMLRCHRSQLARATDRDFSPLTELMRQQCQTRGLQSGVAAAEAFRIHSAFKRARAW
jgi:LmbE family N-acetylglucosaminyl deacetylase